jgi:hypothetical protein
MDRMTLALVMAASLTASACLEKDTTSTMYLRQDGSFDWVILEQNVRSNESDDASRRSEEAGYVDGISRGDTGVVSGLLALGADSVSVRWIRSRRPYAAMLDARFDSLAGVFDRALAPCGIPTESRLAASGGGMTWTVRADVGIDGDRLTHDALEGCGEGLGGLDEALDELRVILESGTFTAATGFILDAPDTARIDHEGLQKAVDTTGLIELSLSWR